MLDLNAIFAAIASTDATVVQQQGIGELWGLKNQSGADSVVKQPSDSHDVSLPAPDS
jgi:hypothetical protein